MSSDIDANFLAKLPEINEADKIYAVGITFIVLQTIFVTLFYLSRYLNKALNGWDCWLFIPTGYIFSILFCICGFLFIKFADVGRPWYFTRIVNPEKSLKGHQLDIINEYLTAASTTGSKLAILALYMRIFSLSSRNYRYAIYFVGTIIVLSWLAALILSSAQCRPFAYLWDSSIPEEAGSCWNRAKIVTSLTIPNITTDILILILPLPGLYRLHVNHATKIGLIATFMVGSIGIVTAIVRMVYTFRLTKDAPKPDYTGVRIEILVMIEIATYFLAACMPNLRPLKRRMFPNLSFTRLVNRILDKLSAGKSQEFSIGSIIKKPSQKTTSIEMKPSEATIRVSGSQTASTSELAKIDTFESEIPPVPTLSRETGDNMV